MLVEIYESIDYLYLRSVARFWHLQWGKSIEISCGFF